jgi:hypothetical protein
MDVTEAQVATARASRYLEQLATHLDHLRDLPHMHSGPVPDRPTVVSVAWSDTEATITFDGARCTLHATDASLTLRLEAATAEQLQTLQMLIGHRVETIGHRDHLQVSWRGSGS